MPRGDGTGPAGGGGRGPNKPIVRVAIATDDGMTFMDRHFGDAKYFDIYDVTDSSSTMVKRIVNTTEEDEAVHADPKKAGGIVGLLSSAGVNVTVSKVFGPNIRRIKKHFVCVRMDDQTIGEARARLTGMTGRIEEEWNKGEDRGFLNLLFARDPGDKESEGA